MSAPGDPRDPFAGASDARHPPDLSDASAESPEPVPLDGAILSYDSWPNAGAAAPGGMLPEGVPPEAPGGWHSNRFLDPDLRVPWGWVDLLLLVIVWIGATVISTILLAILFAARGVAFDQIQHSSRYLGFFVVTDQVVVSIVVLLYLWMQTRLRFNGPFWATLGWRRLETGTRPPLLTCLGFVALGVFLALSVQLVSSAFPAKTKLPIETFLQNRQAALALMVMSVLLAPVVEESIFRGYIYPVVARSFGVPAGVIATGTVFGLLHAEQLWGGWAQIALLVVVGIVFTWIRAWKRTVFASYLLHVSYNSLLFLAFLVSSDGFRSLVHR
jgi:uncharacterized protein